MFIFKKDQEKPDNKNRNRLFSIIGAMAILFIAAGIFYASRPMGAEETPQEPSKYIENEDEDFPQYTVEEEILEDFSYVNTIDTTETQRERRQRIENERIEFSQSITRGQIIEDFDYMMAVLEANFLFFDLTYRVHGVDIREEAYRFRAVLVDETMPIDARVFEQLLLWDFMASIHWVGHIRTVDDFMYHMYMYRVINAPEFRWSTVWYERFTAHPSTFQFYGEFGEYELVAIAPQFIEGGHGPDNYTINIIEEGNIAHIHVAMLYSASYTDRENLRELYKQIADFNHLIIDIRGNPGADQSVFHELITAPHISAPVHLDIVSFYKGGWYNLNLLEIIYDPRFDENSVLAGRPSHFYGETFIIPDGNILGRDGRPLFAGTQYLAWGDFDAFDYYAVGAMKTVYPAGVDGLQSNFNGQLWLLTDNNSFSGSEHVVALYKQNDLAIIVGEQGRGVFMCALLFSNYFALPHTGIIIRYDVGYPVCRLTGHSLEEGIKPHFSNRPGMDALQTTLELIAEGVYLGGRT